ncbi:hypothetical protein [Rhodococcus ruber]|uniref:hypothetical protein n=1 Tax=Rhodococcus ruber TaxID=1830 RepID=UPI001F20F8A5|nr:hypothetical protein [Rhodococcus ruber]
MLSTEFWCVDRVGVKCFQQFAAVLFELLESLGGCLSRSNRIRQQDTHMVKDEVANNAGLLFGEGHGLPVRGDEIFEVGRLDGAEGTPVLEPLTAKAVKVVVGSTYPIAGLLECERFAALATVDRAF